MKTDKKAKETEARIKKYRSEIIAHYKPIWPKIEKHLEKIKNPILKIRYLQDKYHDYMIEVGQNPDISHASGHVVFDISKGEAVKIEIGMDVLISEKIRYIKEMDGIKDDVVLPSETKPNNSFKFNNKDALESIFNRLKRDNYISDEVKKPDFNRIFNEVKLSKELSSINWQGSIASLRYFIRLFPFEMTNLKRWQITAHCFTCDGEIINEKQLERNKEIKTKDKEQLDEIAKLYLTQK